MSTTPASVEIRNHLEDAFTIGDLLLWIEHSRALLQRIQHLYSVNKEFQAIAKDARLDIDSAVWDQAESDALIKLHLCMHTSMYEAKKVTQRGAV